MRQCSECLEELPPYARFCRECGSEQPLSKELPLASDPAEEAEEETVTFDEDEVSEIVDKDTAIITVLNDAALSEVADKDTAIITVLSNPSKELAEYLSVPASIPHKELAEHVAVPISIPHPELFDEPLESGQAVGSAGVEQVGEETIPVMEDEPVGPPKTGELSGALSSKAAEEWRRSWRDLQRVEAGPALDVSRGHALVPEPLAAMEDSLLRIRAIRESARAPEKNLGFWLMLFLLITLIGMLVLLILWTYFPTGF